MLFLCFCLRIVFLLVIKSISRCRVYLIFYIINLWTFYQKFDPHLRLFCIISWGVKVLNFLLIWWNFLRSKCILATHWIFIIIWFCITLKLIVSWYWWFSILCYFNLWWYNTLILSFIQLRAAEITKNINMLLFLRILVDLFIRFHFIDFYWCFY